MTDTCCHDTNSQPHPDYTRELPRLNRIAGQVDGVKKMIQDKRYCPDILIQLRAIRSAVHAVEAAILEAHMDSCVTDAFLSTNEEDKKRKIAELKTLYKKYSG